MSSQDLSPGLLMASSVLFLPSAAGAADYHRIPYTTCGIRSRRGSWYLESLVFWTRARCVSVSVGFLLIDIYSDQNFTLPEARAVSDGSAWCVRVSVHLV